MHKAQCTPRNSRYDISQEYDKDGNRTRFHRNVAGGYTSSYGQAMDLSYTFDVRNNLSAIADADNANYAAAVTSDANMNISEVDESYDNGGGYVNHLYSYFDVDDLNRVTAHRTIVICQLTQGFAGLTLRRVQAPPGRVEQHPPLDYHVARTNSAPRRRADTCFGPIGRPTSARTSWQQNRDYDGSSAYGDQWRWAGTQNSHQSPLHSPNADTAAQTGYNIANDKTPQRRSFLAPTTEGDQRNLYGQGKPQAKDSTGGGANWYVGVTSQPTTVHHASVESRLFFEGTVSATDMSRATDTREKGRIGITGSAQAYAGSNGRVTSEAIGRDINPLGRGGGAALVGGMMNEGRLALRLPGGRGEVNHGNSVNNSCLGCGGSPYGDPQGSPDNKNRDEYNITQCFGKFAYEMRGFIGPTACAIPVCANKRCNCTPCEPHEWVSDTADCVDRHCECLGCGCTIPSGCPHPVDCECEKSGSDLPCDVTEAAEEVKKWLNTICNYMRWVIPFDKVCAALGAGINLADFGLALCNCFAAIDKDYGSAQETEEGLRQFCKSIRNFDNPDHELCFERFVSLDLGNQLGEWSCENASYSDLKDLYRYCEDRNKEAHSSAVSAISGCMDLVNAINTKLSEPGRL